MAKKSYQERVREQREQDILLTAAKLIREHGFNNLNMDVLADDVGISKSTLYQHFSSKENMVKRVLMQSFADLDEHLASSDGEPIQQLESLIHFVLTTNYVADGFATPMIINEVIDMFHTHDDIQPHLAASYDKINQIVEAGKRRGQVNPELDNSVIISSLFALTAVLEAPAVAAGQITAQKMIDQTIVLWLKGIQP